MSKEPAKNTSLSLIECSGFDGDVTVPGERDKKGIIAGSTGSDEVRLLLEIRDHNRKYLDVELIFLSVRSMYNRSCSTTLIINVT